MSRLKKFLGVVGLVSVLFLNGFVFADAKVPEFDGCYLKLSNGEFVEMKLKQARKTYINGTSFDSFMNPSQQVAYVTDKHNITSVNNGEIVGIAWRDANIIKFKDYVSVHPLVEKTKAECILPDDISVVYAPGRVLELRSKSLSKDTYYYKPRDKFPDGEYVVWLGKKFYLFRVGSASQEKITQTPLELAKLGSKYLSQKNYIKAKSYFEKACAKGNMPSCHNLAYLYRKGEGVEKDIQKAKELYMKSCNNDFLNSCTELGGMYTYGTNGIEKNEAKAMKLYAKSCDGGDEQACKNLRSRSILDSAPLQGTRNKSGSESVNGNDSVNPNSSLVSKQKDQQSTQPLGPVSNQLTDAERQELEQLRAEKAEAARKKETTSESVSQSQTEKSKSFQNTRTDSYETYLARISQKDHFGKRGQKLKGAGTILQQDRANYHKYYKRDREDRGDSRFGTRDNRDKIKRMLAKGSTSQKTLDAIRYSTPLVKVRIYKEHIDVTLESNGVQTRQRQHRKTSAQRTTVPVMIGGDPELDACGATGVIQGISRRGDGFVAVRSGPGAKYKMIDKFYRNGAKVTMCDDKGKWVGIVYGKDCGEAYDNIAKRKPYEGTCRSGWVYEQYIRLIAG